MLRCPGADYFRPRPAVLLFSLGRTDSPPGREDAVHHSLPPPVKRSGGAVPPPPEGLPTGAVGGRGLARPPALGVTRAPGRPSRRFRRVGGRTGVWFSTVLTRPVSYRRRAATVIIRAPAAVHCPLRGGQIRLLAPPPTPPPASLRWAQFIYVRSPPLSPGPAPAFRGPYRVRVPGVKYFVIDIGSKPSAVSVDNIKPHLGSSPLSAAPPPRRGRPPRQV